MNKNDLVERLSEEHDLTKAFARDLVESVLQTILETARRGEEVSIFGFGRFRVVDRAARQGRNVQTGEPMKIAASKTLKFTPAPSLKTSLNTKRRTKKGA